MKIKIKLQQGQRIFFTSDTHYDHKNICSATTTWDLTQGIRGVRNFNSLDHMNDVLVNNINNIVGPDDILFHLGDWSFNGFENIRKFRERINCQNIYIVLGNHDHHIENNKEGIQELFKLVSVGNLELEVKPWRTEKMIDPPNYHFFLNHYPTCSWKDMSKGVIHLHGHVHLPYQVKISQGRAMDVGVDGGMYEPYELREIISIMRGQRISPISLPQDHHMDEVK